MSENYTHLVVRKAYITYLHYQKCISTCQIWVELNVILALVGNTWLYYGFRLH